MQEWHDVWGSSMQGIRPFLSASLHTSASQESSSIFQATIQAPAP